MQTAANKKLEMPGNGAFLTDVKTLRERARKHIEQGAVTDGYQADRKVVINILNEALATEIVCVLRYKRHYFMAEGINAESVAAEFAQHATEEQAHADLIAQRIVQLGGEPNLSPDGLASRSHSEYVEGATLVDMIKEDLVAERIAIDSYKEMVAYIGAKDSTTRREGFNHAAHARRHPGGGGRTCRRPRLATRRFSEMMAGPGGLTQGGNDDGTLVVSVRCPGHHRCGLVLGAANATAR